MGGKKIPKSKQELTRSKVKFALSLKVKPRAIAKKARITDRTVKNIKQRRLAKRRKGSGRKEILNKSDKLRIIHRLKRNPFTSLGVIATELNLTCSLKTIRNYLHYSGFKWRKPEHKAPLSRDDKQSRFLWCENYNNFKYWDRVVFSDEASFWIFDNNKPG